MNSAVLPIDPLSPSGQSSLMDGDTSGTVRFTSKEFATMNTIESVIMPVSEADTSEFNGNGRQPEKQSGLSEVGTSIRRPKKPSKPAPTGLEALSSVPPEIPPSASCGLSQPPDDDPFSPENLKVSQDFAGMTQTRKLLTAVRVGKPNKEAWVRTSCNPEHWIVGSVLELKDQGDETYWLLPAVRDALIGEPCMKAVRLILSVDRQGTPFFWKIAMPDPTGRSQPWVDSMNEAAEIAKSQWVRAAWSMATRAYETTVAEIKAEPKWPVESLRDLLNIAFRGRIVNSLDHPVLRNLRGQE